MRPLPKKFALLIALMDGSSYDHERINAREMATRLAENHGWMFETALRRTTRSHPRDLPPTREEAAAAEEASRREAALRDAERQQWEARIAPIVALYGSLAAALAPCWRESTLLRSVARWRVAHPACSDRWTATLDGCLLGKRVSAAVFRAVERAYPMPKTFSEARAELDYWAAREDELLLLRAREPIKPQGSALDIVVIARKEAITSLMRHGLRARTIEDVRQRMLAIRDTENLSSRCWKALRQDIVELSARSSEASYADGDLNMACRIRRLLEQNAGWSDRAIAREVGCSPTTVGKVRRDVMRA